MKLDSRNASLQDLAGAFDRLLEHHGSFRSRLEEYRNEAHTHLQAREEEVQALQARLAEALGQSAEVQKDNLALKQQVEQQARDLAALDEARQEIRGLLKTNEVMREARQRDQEKLAELTTAQEASEAERRQLIEKLAAIEGLVRQVIGPLTGQTQAPAATPANSRTAA
jgi:chromosome segregation ATPase